jgi:microcystin-dependent protein
MSSFTNIPHLTSNPSPFGNPVNNTLTTNTAPTNPNITYFNSKSPLFVPIGATGIAKGDTGSTGPTGPQGFQGVPGTATNTGATGPVGTQGPQGFTGPAGSAVNTGATGHSGHSGPTGPTGPQGVPGSATNTGATGNTGITGPQGTQGPQGAIGTATNTGATGPAGTNGNTGPKGATGAQGPLGGLPTGSIMAYAGTVTPSGWLLCQGQTLSTATYPALFNAIGYTYGGSGASFILPDLRTKIVRAVGPAFALGATGGADTVGLTVNNLPAHNHAINDPGHFHPTVDPGHAHFITEPNSGQGHQHSSPSVASTSGQGKIYTADNTNYGPGIATSFSTTGITINNSYTGVSNQVNTTGISTANTGTGSLVTVSNPYIVMNMIIKD